MSSKNSQAIADKIFSYNVFKDLDRNALLKKYDISGAIYEINSTTRSSKGQIPQREMEISAIPPQGIVISHPGSYTFAANIIWNAADEACSAITITADNVVLDMCNFSLTAIVQDNSQFITGISIQNASAVHVLNGRLVNMCFYGIYAEFVSGLTIKDMTVDGISFSNLNIRNLSPAGIHIDKAINITIANCVVQNMNVTSDASAGIQILDTITGTVKNCSMTNFVNNDGSVQGYSYLASTNISTINCTSVNFQSHFNGNTKTLGHTVLGFVPIFCLELVYENCAATNMIGCCDDCHGMSVFLDAGITVINFTANTVIDGIAQSNSGAKATGLEVYGAAVSITNCTVENIKAINPQDRQSAGFSAAGTEISFINCRAIEVIVTDEKGNTDPDLGYGTGFGWAPDPRVPFINLAARNVVYKDCSSTNCQVGFDTWNHIASIWENVSYVNCGINILVQPNGSRILSCNPCSECDPSITATITNMASGNILPSSIDTQ